MLAGSSRHPLHREMKDEPGRKGGQLGCQKMIFAPNCNWRELFAVLFALPKLD